MTYTDTHHSVILLLDGRPAANNKSLRRWFKKSRFVTCECADVFDAFEKISDFTMRRRPNVVLLEVESMTDGFRTAKKMTREFSEENETPVFAFSDGGNVWGDGECFDGSLAKLEARLNSLIPVYAKARRTIAA